MVHLLQVSVVLTALALIALGVVLYNEYYGAAQNNVSEIIEIIANQTGLSGNGSGGGVTVDSSNGTVTNASGPQLLILNNNTDIQILQNTVNGTEYTAILFTNS